MSAFRLRLKLRRIPRSESAQEHAADDNGQQDEADHEEQAFQGGVLCLATIHGRKAIVRPQARPVKVSNTRISKRLCRHRSRPHSLGSSIPCTMRATRAASLSNTGRSPTVISHQGRWPPFTVVRNRDRELRFARRAFDDPQLVSRQRGNRARGTCVN